MSDELASVVANRLFGRALELEHKGMEPDEGMVSALASVRSGHAILRALAAPQNRDALVAGLVDAGALVVNSVGFSGKVKSYRIADTREADRG